MDIHSKTEFEQDVLQSDLPVLVYFSATWCGRCRMQKPILKIIERDKADIVKIAKVDVEENADLKEEYAVTGTPTMLMMNGGKEVARFVGVMTKESIEDFIMNNV